MRKKWRIVVLLSLCHSECVYLYREVTYRWLCCQQCTVQWSAIHQPQQHHQEAQRLRQELPSQWHCVSSSAGIAFNHRFFQPKQHKSSLALIIVPRLVALSLSFPSSLFHSLLRPLIWAQSVVPLSVSLCCCLQCIFYFILFFLLCNVFLSHLPSFTHQHQHQQHSLPYQDRPVEALLQAAAPCPLLGDSHCGHCFHSHFVLFLYRNNFPLVLFFNFLYLISTLLLSWLVLFEFLNLETSKLPHCCLESFSGKKCTRQA